MGDKAAVAIVRRIASTALALSPADGRYMATCPLSTPAGPGDLAVLASPVASSRPEALDAAVGLSKLADRVQDGGAVFRTSGAGGYVSDAYRALTPLVEFAVAAPDAAAREEYERAEATLFSDPPFVRTDGYDRYATLKSDLAFDRLELADAQIELDGLDRRPAGMGDPARAELLRARIAVLTRRVPLSEEALDALDDQFGFEAALAVWQAARLTGFPTSVVEARALLDGSLLDVWSPLTQERHVRVRFAPPEPVDDRWMTVRVTREDIAAAPDDDPLPGAGAPAQDVRGIEGDAIDAVELQVQVLEIERPWMWDALWARRDWRWRVSTTDVSDGGDPPQGALPAYPVAVVLARRLRITGRAGIADVTAVAPGVAVPMRLGPFLPVRPVPVSAVPDVPAAPDAVARTERRMLSVPDGDRVARAAMVLRPVTVRGPGQATVPGLAPLPGLGPFGPEFWPIPVPSVPTVTVVVGLRDPGGGLSPLQLPVPVTVLREDTGDRQEYTVPAGSHLAVALDPGRYRFSASCGLYDPDGPDVVDVDAVSGETLVAFAFRPRTLLTEDEVQVVGFLCRRVPRAPDPGPGQLWP